MCGSPVSQKRSAKHRLAYARARQELGVAGKPGAFYSRGKSDTLKQYNTRVADASWRRFQIAQETPDE
jgi:hypothetical protein